MTYAPVEDAPRLRMSQLPRLVLVEVYPLIAWTRVRISASPAV
jgi:hypothetical protein